MLSNLVVLYFAYKDVMNKSIYQETEPFPIKSFSTLVVIYLIENANIAQ